MNEIIKSYLEDNLVIESISQPISDEYKKPILEFYSMVMSEMNFPLWVFINCPHCGNKLKVEAIRNIAPCFNAKNFGDMSMEFLCTECARMDTVYWKDAFQTMEDICNLLNGKMSIDGNPMTENEMYRDNHNNIMERKRKCQS